MIKPLVREKLIRYLYSHLAKKSVNMNYIFKNLIAGIFLTACVGMAGCNSSKGDNRKAPKR